MYWLKAAQKKILTDRIWAVRAARLAMAENKAYADIMNGLEGELRELEMGKNNNVVEENWDDLKNRGRG